MLTGGKLDELVNVLGAATAAACFFQAEFGFELAGHHDACPARVADIRLCDSFAQAEIHTASLSEWL